MGVKGLKGKGTVGCTGHEIKEDILGVEESKQGT